MNHIDDRAFIAVYALGVIVVGIFAIQGWRFRRRHPGWGASLFFGHLVTKLLFIADLFMLRSVWQHDTGAAWGANGWVTLVIRVAWVGSLAAVVVAARRGAILEDPIDCEVWDGSERRHYVRRAADRP